MNTEATSYRCHSKDFADSQVAANQAQTFNLRASNNCNAKADHVSCVEGATNPVADNNLNITAERVRSPVA